MRGYNVIVWSYGGGVQSAAIGVLIAQGKLPKPDLAVIADTGREASSTWDYLRDHMNPHLVPTGLQIAVAPHSLALRDLYSKDFLILPAFLSSGGKLPTYCSIEWKRRVIRRWARLSGVISCDMWLGISVDEIERAKDSDVAWAANVYPLLTLVPMRRAECVALISNAGLPIPEKSACWMCPFRNNYEWRRMKDRSPEDWSKAVEMDRAIRLGSRGTNHQAFLHRSLVPLDEAPINAGEEQQSLDLCDSGHCWT